MDGFSYQGGRVGTCSSTLLAGAGVAASFVRRPASW